MQNTKGFSDLPNSDINFTLGGERYFKGIANFICQCETPMTISIQGDWGTGKTTTMKTIQHIIENDDAQGDKIKFMWFEAWPYSNTMLQDALGVVLLQSFYSELEQLTDNNSALAGKLNEARNNITSFVAGAFDLAGLDGIGSMVRRGYEAVNQENANKYIKHIQEIKKDIADLLDSVLAEDERIVVLIDDLDRLQPKVAIDLLEGMKNFLDCKKCVFVVAIDFDIIKDGVIAKYGNVSDEKIVKFFDKFIQVPFWLPVSSYDIENYVYSFLDESEMDLKVKYYRAVKGLLGANPREIKRAFNLFSLYKMMFDKQYRQEYRLQLFKALLIQMRDQQLFFTLLDLANTNESAFYEYVLGQDENIEESNLRYLKTIRKSFSIPDELPNSADKRSIDKFAGTLRKISIFIARENDDNCLGYNYGQEIIDKISECEVAQELYERFAQSEKYGLDIDGSSTVTFFNEIGEDIFAITVSEYEDNDTKEIRNVFNVIIYNLPIQLDKDPVEAGAPLMQKKTDSGGGSYSNDSALMYYYNEYANRPESKSTIVILGIQGCTKVDPIIKVLEFYGKES